jgi:hypothetical protein
VRISARGRDLDPPFRHRDGSPGRVRVDGEDGSLDRRREQTRLHAEVRHRLLFDLVERLAIGFDHLDEALGRAFARDGEAGRRRKDDDVAAADQHRAAARTGAQRVAWRKLHAARGGHGPAAMVEHDRPAGLADSPLRRLSRPGGRADCESQDQDREAGAHSRPPPRRPKRRQTRPTRRRFRRNEKRCRKTD